MARTPEVSTCANPECNQRFRRLGEGRLAVFPIDDPERWDLPRNAKQKGVWLCARCASQMFVRLDRKHYRVQVVHTQISWDKRVA